ncbi:MAG TPA: hypothetical protein VHG09_11975 [Longimicrobiales bacterium]|nr:hypothetical protein [Longimicrobiales bacterium]
MNGHFDGGYPMQIQTSRRVRRRVHARLAAIAMLALSTGACDLDLVNPTVLARDEVDPNLLVNGAIESWMQGWNSAVISEWYASDEAVSTDGTSASNRMLDETGDLTVNSTYFSGFAFAEMLDGREETRIAAARAQTVLDAAADSAQRARATVGLQRAKAYNAWFVTHLARRRGDQPIQPGGEVLTELEQYEHALSQFEDVIVLATETTDSMRINALGGSARVSWMIGSATGDEARLEAAITAAEEALGLAPNLMWAFEWPYAYISDWYVNNWGIAAPGSTFADIPIPATIVGIPQGDMFVDADALWLIKADAHLQLGETPEARSALASTPLLLTNHVGLAGRDPDGPALSQAEADAWVATLTAEEVQHAIDELWRENFYLRGDRNVDDSGAPIFPIPLPPNALEVE